MFCQLFSVQHSMNDENKIFYSYPCLINSAEKVYSDRMLQVVLGYFQHVIRQGCLCALLFTVILNCFLEYMFDLEQKEKLGASGNVENRTLHQVGKIGETLCYFLTQALTVVSRVVYEISGCFCG